MSYTAQFKNINNILYQIDITTNSDNTITELILTNEPFIVDYSGGETIYEPLKLSNATCNIVTNELLLDLYGNKAQDVKITLTNLSTSTIEWIGYVTPNIYTQNFENEYETLSLECVDGISILDNYIYETVNIDNKYILSFKTILVHILKKSNCYKNIYINKKFNTLLTPDNQLDNLLITEQNFFNNTQDEITYNALNNKIITINDTSSTMKYKEVLYDLMSFLGCTCIPFGDSVYILDYDFLKNGYTDYFKLSTTNNWGTYNETSVTLNHTHNITSSSFKLNGGTIELTPTYNSVSIKTNLNKEDIFIPEFFDDDSLTNVYGVDKWDWNVTHVDVPGGGVGSKLYYNKYYYNKYYDNIHYNNDVDWVATYNSVNYDITLNGIGSAFVRMGSSDNVLDFPSYSNYIQLYRHLPHNRLHAIIKPVLKLKVGAVPQTSYLFDEYYNLIISGSALWFDLEGVSYINEKHKRTSDTLNFNPHLTARIKIGDKYWDGSNWVLYPSDFLITFDRGKETHLINKWFEVKNTCIYYGGSYSNLNIDGKGQNIPINGNYKLMGDIEFILYSPVNVLPAYRVDNVYLKDFKVELKKTSNVKGNNTDTEYKNVIDDNFVNEFSEINLNICTQTDKGMSYSAVIEKQGSNYFYNNMLYDKGLGKVQKQEFNIIEKIVNQYSIPKKKLNLTLGNIYKPYTLFGYNLFPNEKYIVDSMSIDYYNNNNNLTIIEKV